MILQSTSCGLVGGSGRPPRITTKRRIVEGDQWWGCFVQFVVKKIKHKVRSPHRQVALPVESPDTLDFSRIGRRRKDFEYGNCNTMLKYHSQGWLIGKPTLRRT